jgi:hypothetical protein
MMTCKVQFGTVFIGFSITALGCIFKVYTDDNVHNAGPVGVCGETRVGRC